MFTTIVGVALMVSQPITGMATYQGKGVVQGTYAYRLGIGQIRPCPECVGFVALLDPEDIGRKVWVVYRNRTIGPLLAVDCAAKKHRSYLLSRDWVVDLSWEIGQMLGMLGPIRVEIWDEDPRIRGDDRLGGRLRRAEQLNN